MHESNRGTNTGWSGGEGGFDPAFFDSLAAIEDRHFWFCGRNRLIFELCRRITSQFKPGYCVLEAGCGTGNVLRFLERACAGGRVFGMDRWLEGLQYARKRSRCPLVQGDMRDHPFQGQFELVCMFDVLEHLADDVRVLEDLRKLVAPGCRLLLTVPAHQSLWSYFDESARHCRRYSVKEIRRKLAGAGYEVEFVTEFMACTFPLVWLARRLTGLRNRHIDAERARELAVNEFRIVPLINPILKSFLNLEARWVAARHPLPFGTSLLVLAVRK